MVSDFQRIPFQLYRVHALLT